VSSGRCIFSGDKYALALDFKNIDEVKPEDSIMSRRILYSPVKKYGSIRLQN
jgi:hypothetical protein